MSMEKIAHFEITSGTQAEIEFANLPQNYTDLLIVTSTRTNFTPDAAVFLPFKINGTLQNSGEYQYGIGTSTNAGSAPLGATLGGNATANAFALTSFYIANYTAASVNKRIYINGGTGLLGGSGFEIFSSAVFSGGAITSFAIGRSDSSLVQYSSATIYGITSGDDGVTTATS